MSRLYKSFKIAVAAVFLNMIAHNHERSSGSEIPKIENNRLLESIPVTTVNDLIDNIEKVADSGDITAVVHAMAVLDYIPESPLDTKKKSGEQHWDIKLVKTPKVIGIIRKLMPDAYCVGFKLEAGVADEQLIEKAGILLQSYNLDLVIANDLDRVSETRHEAIFVGKENRILKHLHTKTEIAENIAEIIVERFK